MKKHPKKEKKFQKAASKKTKGIQGKQNDPDKKSGQTAYIPEENENEMPDFRRFLGCGG